MLTNPPPIEYDDLTLLKIKVNMMRKDLSYQLYNITMTDDIEHIKQNIHSLLDKLEEDTLDLALSHFNNNAALKLLPGALSESHYGSCTGCACGCDRCYFEELSEQSTVTWSKNDGRNCIRLLSE